MKIVRLIQMLVVVVLMPFLFSCAGTGEIKPSAVTVVYGFDGTGQNIKYGKKTSVYHFLMAHRTSNQSVTNIYAGGVGSLKPGKAHILNFPGKWTGLGGREIVERVYTQLVSNFKNGHKGIVIVGFSRGAALSREYRGAWQPNIL